MSQRLGKLAKKCGLTDIDPEGRGESTTDSSANVGIAEEGRLWVLDYGLRGRRYG